MRILGALLLLLAGGAAAAYEAAFVSTAQIDLTELLPPPPAAGSDSARQDLDAVFAAQAARTPDSIAAARADAKVSVFRFADVLGPAFTAERLPKTEALFRTVSLDATEIGVRAKQYWDRPRPYRFTDRITALVDVATDGSYPSGHASYGCMTAVLLGVMVPEKRAELMARGRAYGWNRVVAGVHYPSDVEAGCQSGTLIAAVLLQEPRFRPALADSRDEVRRVLGLGAGQLP